MQRRKADILTAGEMEGAGGGGGRDDARTGLRKSYHAGNAPVFPIIVYEFSLPDILVPIR